jgi:hypothetical protein
VSVYSGKESYLGNLSLPCIQGVGGINVWETLGYEQVVN